MSSDTSINPTPIHNPSTNNSSQNSSSTPAAASAVTALAAAVNSKSSTSSQQQNSSNRVRPQNWRRDKSRPAFSKSGFLKSEFQKNRDALIRMNFLFQSAKFYSEFQPPVGNSQIGGNRSIARFYAATMKKIASRLVIRLDSSIKNSICKRCGSVLVSGPMAVSESESIKFGGSTITEIEEIHETGNETPLLRRLCLACGSSSCDNLRKEIRSSTIQHFNRKRRNQRRRIMKKIKKLQMNEQNNSQNNNNNNNTEKENSSLEIGNFVQMETEEIPVENVHSEK